MREILFKAQRCDNHEWVEGNLFNGDDGTYEICIGSPRVRITYEVIPETICQFTGLFDKNGNKIWENDIVCTQYIDPIFQSTWNENIDYTEKHQVKFKDSCFYVEIKDKKNLMITAFQDKIEVVGNIFDNLEMIE